MADTNPLCDQLATAWHDAICPEGPLCRDRVLHAASTPTNFIIRQALLPVVERHTAAKVNEALERAVIEIKARAAEMATRSRDFGRGYSAAADVIGSLKDSLKGGPR